MEITNIYLKIISIEDSSPHSKMKALCSITIDDMFVIHDIRIIEGHNGLFVAMPSKRVGDTYKDIAHPIHSEAREYIQKAILEEYHKRIKVGSEK